jgi:PE family
VTSSPIITDFSAGRLVRCRSQLPRALSPASAARRRVQRYPNAPAALDESVLCGSGWPHADKVAARTENTVVQRRSHRNNRHFMGQLRDLAACPSSSPLSGDRRLLRLRSRTIQKDPVQPPRPRTKRKRPTGPAVASSQSRTYVTPIERKVDVVDRTQAEALTAVTASLETLGPPISTHNAAHSSAYQQISAEATAIHELFVSTLTSSASSYATEVANAAAVI